MFKCADVPILTSTADSFRDNHRNPALIVFHVERANLRRDLEPGERAMGYAALARMKVGRPTAVVSNDAEPALFDPAVNAKTNSSIEPIVFSTSEAAEKAGVTVATMERAMSVDRNGSPELIEAVKNGDIAVSAALDTKAAWRENGLIMLHIRNAGLYKAKYGTFEAYLETRWDYGRSTGYQMLAAAEFLQKISYADSNKLSAIADKTNQVLPANEGQIRPLLTDLNHDGERLKVWQDVAQSGEKITALLVQRLLKLDGENVLSQYLAQYVGRCLAQVVPIWRVITGQRNPGVTPAQKRKRLTSL